MPSILLPAPNRLQEPPFGARLNRASPLAQGLRGLWLLNEGGGLALRDLVSEAHLIAQANTAWHRLSAGQGVRYHDDGTSADGYLAGGVAAGHQLIKFTHLAWYMARSGNTASQTIMSIAEAPGDTTQDRGLYTNGSSQFTLSIFDGATKTVSSTTTASADVPVLVVATVDGSNMRLYVNGVLEGTTAAGNAYTGYASPELTFGYGWNGTATNARGAGTLFLAAVASRAWSDAEVRAFSADPYQLVAPSVWRRYFIPPSSGVTGTGAITIGAPQVAGTGTFTTTGSGAISIGVPVLAATGSFATTGTGAISIGVPVIAGTGSFAVTGTGAVSIGTPVLAATGSFATTGTGAISIGIPVLAGTGTVSGPPGSGDITIAPPVLAGTGTFATTGTGAIAIGGPAVAGSGTVADPGTGSGAISIGPPQAAGTGSFATTGAGAVSISPPVLAGSGTFVGPASGTGVITIPAPVLAGTGTLIYTGSGTIAIPGPLLSGYSVLATRAAASDSAYGGAVGSDAAYTGSGAGDLALVGATASDSEV